MIWPFTKGRRKPMLEAPKEPFNVPLVVVAIVAFWGAAVSYLTKTKFMGVPAKTLIFGFFKEIIICTFAAFLVHISCMMSGITGWANIFLVAVGAHMGTEAIKLMESIFRGKFSLMNGPLRRREDQDDEPGAGN